MAGTSVVLVEARWEGMLLHKLKELHSQGLFCDTAVYFAGGERLRAHSVILAAASPFFLSILKNPVAGLCLFLDQFNKQAVVPVLEFAYTGRVSVEMEELPVIQAVAESLGFFGLGVSECYQSLTAHQHQKGHTVPKQVITIATSIQFTTV